MAAKQAPPWVPVKREIDIDHITERVWSPEILNIDPTREDVCTMCAEELQQWITVLFVANTSVSFHQILRPRSIFKYF